MSSAVAKVARPTGMKGQLVANIRKNMIIASVIASVTTAGWYFGVVQERKAAYADFYKTLDVEKMYNRQKSKGVFWCTKDLEE